MTDIIQQQPEKQPRKKCVRCKMNLLLTEFTEKRDGTSNKQCNHCNEVRRAYKASHKCEHNRQKDQCKDCGGGSICEHNKRRNRCKDCGGSQICEHNRRRNECKNCDLEGFVKRLICKHNKRVSSSELLSDSLSSLGCGVNDLRQHIERQFEPDMTWANHGILWEIDHIVPLKYRSDPDIPPTFEEMTDRLHYTNVRPLYKHLNQLKGNKIDGEW